MRPGIGTATILLALLAGGPLPAQEVPAAADPAAEEMTWPEATELLRREKQSGEVCARVTKRFLPPDDLAALSWAELQYTEASSAFNGVIAGLQAALDDKQEDLTLADVEERLTAGSEARQAFCDEAKAMVPPAEPGEKGILGDVVAASLGELIKAGVSIWERLRDDDALRRAALKTALEDAKWPAFSDIAG